MRLSHGLRILAVALVAAFPAKLQAHPHVWVTGTAAFHLENAAVARVTLRWQFDAFFSQVLMGDFDKDKDAKLDAEETAAMKAQVFTNLKEYGYFVHMKAGGAPVDVGAIENFSAVLDKDSQLVFAFDAVPATKPDLRAGKLAFALFDPTIYVDIMLGGDAPVTLDGAGAKDCSWKMRDLDQIANENGFVAPQELEITCKS
jgi:ABC-type uncharacterized transport system substrate-binding protein